MIPNDENEMYENDITESFEKGEWKSVLTAQRRKHLEKYAKNTLNRNERVNIKISSKDLYDIQIRAVEEGIPYETLIASVLHKYLSGRLVEKQAL